MIVEDNEEFSLKSGVNVSEAVRNIVADISELGWLFRNIVANL